MEVAIPVPLRASTVLALWIALDIGSTGDQEHGAVNIRVVGTAFIPVADDAPECEALGILAGFRWFTGKGQELDVSLAHGSTFLLVTHSPVLP